MSCYESICGCMWSGYEPDRSESVGELAEEFGALFAAWNAAWEAKVEAHDAYACQRRQEPREHR